MGQAILPADSLSSESNRLKGGLFKKGRVILAPMRVRSDERLSGGTTTVAGGKNAAPFWFMNLPFVLLTI